MKQSNVFTLMQTIKLSADSEEVFRMGMVLFTKEWIIKHPARPWEAFHNVSLELCDTRTASMEMAE